MQLYGSSRSPHVRRVLIAAHETGLADHITLNRVVVTTLAPNPAMLAITPLGQVPTLVLDDGEVLYDAAVICRYLDRVLGQGALHPGDPMAEVRMMRRMALGDGLTAVLQMLMSEKSRQQPEQSALRTAALRAKLPHIFATLEGEAPAMIAAPFDMGQIAVTAALAYLDFRLSADVPWKANYPALAQWFETVSLRPSVATTAFFDDLAKPPA